jgi:hypothetical protein
VIKESFIQFLCDLYGNKVTLNDSIDNTDAIDKVSEAKEDTDYREREPMQVFYDDEDFDPCDEIYDEVDLEEKAERDIANSRTGKSLFEEQKKAQRDLIAIQVESYIRYCSEIKIMKLLKEFGNDEFKKVESYLEILDPSSKKFKDASYIANLFDLLKWWKLFGTKNFKELSCGAAVLFGKPTHNGFQERVFSRGTYADCKLKKKLKPENFEMKVLNSLNIEEMEKITNEITFNKNLERIKMRENVINFFKTTEENSSTVNSESIQGVVGNIDMKTVAQDKKVCTKEVEVLSEDVETDKDGKDNGDEESVDVISVNDEDEWVDLDCIDDSEIDDLDEDEANMSTAEVSEIMHCDFDDAEAN